MDNNVKTPSGYIRIRTYYISLPFLLALSFGIIAFIILYTTALHPVVVRRWYGMQKTPEFKLDSPYLGEYTGNARLVLSDGTLLYEGAVEAAAAQGEGKLYENNRLIYEGGFAKNKFSGHGRLYENGALVYEGEFTENKFSGHGKLYENENPVYEGGFSEGLYFGGGKQFGTDGRLLYDGDFVAGLYDGKGRLYKSGVLLYEGEFAAGMYNGTGTKYNTGTGYPEFSGRFLDNTPMTAGVLYDENGSPIALPEEQPESAPNPLLLLGKGYNDVAARLESAGIAAKGQPEGDEYIIIDEETGVIYSFRLTEDGMPEYLSRIYYYGLLSADGVVVGADISDIPGGFSVSKDVNAVELLALGYASILWGRDAVAAKLRGMMFVTSDYYTITAFYLPTDPPAASFPAPNATEDAVQAAGESGAYKAEGRIYYLRIDHLHKG